MPFQLREVSHGEKPPTPPSDTANLGKDFFLFEQVSWKENQGFNGAQT